MGVLLLLVDENRGGWLVVLLLLLITFGILTVASRAVLTLVRTVVTTTFGRRVVLISLGGNVELAATDDMLPSGNSGNSGSSFCTY